MLVVIVVLGLLAALILPAMCQAREASRRADCQSNLRMIGLAMTLYSDQRGNFPPGYWGPSATPEGREQVAAGWGSFSTTLPFGECSDPYERTVLSGLTLPDDAEQLADELVT